MKHFNFIKKLMFMPVLATVALTSCEDKAVESTSFQLSSSVLPNISTETTVTHSSPAVGEVITISVAAEGSLTWSVKATAKAEMFTITPDVEQSKSGEISITVKPNTLFSTRVGRVVISNSYTKVDHTINFTQAAAGTPALTINPGNRVIDIAAQGNTYNFSITSMPVTALTFQVVDDATWIAEATPEAGSTHAWTVGANPSSSPRTGKIAIKYDNGTKAIDTLYFTQVGAENIPTPEVKVNAADVHAYNTLITWTPSPDVLTMKITLNGGASKIVPCSDGKLFVRDLTPSTAYTVTAVGNTANGALDAKTVTFTSKGPKEEYMFKDGSVAKNVSFWHFALINKKGTPIPNDIKIKSNYTYDTLAMITDLMLSFQFAQNAGVVDLIQMPNLTNLQIGRGYYDNGVDRVTRAHLDAVLTQAHFPKFKSLGVWIDITSPVPAATQEMLAAFAADNTWFTFDPKVKKSLKFPNAMPDPTTEWSQVATVAELGLVSRSAWKVVSWSTQEPTGELPSGRVAQMLDGDFATYYHSQWSGGAKPTLPHEIVIDLGKATTFTKLVMSNRVGGNRDSRPDAYTVSFSNDVPSVYPTDGDLNNGVSFPLPTMSWGAETEIINNSDFASTAGSVCANVFTLPSAVTARCIKIKITRVQATNFSVNMSEFGVK